MINKNKNTMEIKELIRDMDHTLEKLLKVSQNQPTAFHNTKQMKAIINVMKMQYPNESNVS